MMDERLRRWRLVLGGGAADGIGMPLHGEDFGLDQSLGALYDPEKRGGLGASSPSVARWLGDIRRYFPGPVVQVLQRDALERLELKKMLLEPELLGAMEPDVSLVASLLALSAVLPNRTRATARQVVSQVVRQLEQRLANPLRQAVLGGLQSAERSRRPRLSEIDWTRTIRENLRHYRPELGTIVPERRSGRKRRRSALRDIVLCADQSGSMASSVVYAGIFAAVLASLPSVRTHMVVFDTSVVDLTEKLADPVELLFGTQLGGGTDIHQALGYCQGLVQRPHETILVLLSDLQEGGDRRGLLRRAAALTASGVQLIALLALSDEGAPAYDAEMASGLAALGVVAFACTPDSFPDLMAAALRRDDLGQWASERGIATLRTEGDRGRSSD